MPPFRGECLQCHENNVFAAPTDYELRRLLIQHHYDTKEIFDGDGCTQFRVRDESTDREVTLNELGGELYYLDHVHVWPSREHIVNIKKDIQW